MRYYMYIFLSFGIREEASVLGPMLGVIGSIATCIIMCIYTSVNAMIACACWVSTHVVASMRLAGMTDRPDQSG